MEAGFSGSTGGFGDRVSAAPLSASVTKLYTEKFGTKAVQKSIIDNAVNLRYNYCEVINVKQYNL